jgi:hypothetical protein
MIRAKIISELGTTLAIPAGVQVIEVTPSKTPNRAGISLPSPEDGNRSGFRSFVFSSI